MIYQRDNRLVKNGDYWTLSYNYSFAIQTEELIDSNKIGEFNV